MDVRTDISPQEMIEFYELEARRNLSNTPVAINYYSRAVSIFNNWQNLTPEDNRKFSDICHQLANCYFYKNQYKFAAEYYLKGARLLQEIKDYTDKDSRELIKLYIDLTDTFLEMKDQLSANNAFSNAIVAFNRIREKQPEERAISDPSKNYQKFYHYWEDICSDVSYRRSIEFNNNKHFFYEQYQNELSVGELEMQLGGLTTTNQDIQSRKPTEAEAYAQIDIPEQLKDKQYRSIVPQYIKWGDNYYLEKDYQASMNSYQQALETLELIKDKNEDDCLLIKQLSDNVVALQAAIRHQVDETRMPFQNQPAAAARTSTMGIYGIRLQGSEFPSQKPDQDKDYINRMEM